ncbi:MAG: NAD-dependent DNA ligase LigA, partial [Lentisphaerae bacterium]|nr:NAD-dependent DNA ligase LigA [Lentisphaerota bacterium]
MKAADSHDSGLKRKAALLRKEINRHNHLYYVQAKPEISDRDYDLLYAELETIERAHPELITADSPTLRVGGAPLNEFSSIQHVVPMLSLDKTFTKDDVREFHSRMLKM